MATPSRPSAVSTSGTEDAHSPDLIIPSSIGSGSSQRAISGCLTSLRVASSRRSAANTGTNFSIALTPDSRREACAASPVTVSRNVSAPLVPGARSSDVGSGMTQASARQPRCSRAYVPSPPSSSPITVPSSRSPASGTPERRRTP